MKHTVTNLEAPNKPVMFTNSILGNYFFYAYFGEVASKKSLFAELLHCTMIGELNQEDSSINHTDVELEKSNLDRIESSI